jgi:hypothetical protein
MSKITKKYSDVDVSRLSFTDFEENARSKGQKIAYVRYNDQKHGESTLIMQTPWISLDTYGIPRAGEYYKDENSRSFIKVPLDQDDESVKLLHDKMVELDDILANEDKKAEIFGSAKAGKSYQYQPIIRVPVTEDMVDDSDDEKPKYARPPYMKTKFHLDYESGNMKTKLYKKNKDGQREEVGAVTLNDIEKYVTYRSKVRLILMPNKLWGLKTYNGKKYGLSWKVMQIEVQPVERSAMKDVFSTDAFLDSDDEGEVASVQKLTVKETLEVKQDDDDNESDESDDSDSDSDSSDDEDEKPSKKSSKSA